MRRIFEKADVVPLVAEVFRALGYEGAAMSAIMARTGLSKGSLYHFFPGGKQQMAAEVLAHVDGWFAREIFAPLERDPPRAAIAAMWRATAEYFHSGRRICLMGAFALDETRDHFAEAIQSYFARWLAALSGALTRAGLPAEAAQRLAEDALGGIQGALVLARALNDSSLFDRMIAAMTARVEVALDRARDMTLDAAFEAAPDAKRPGDGPA